MLQRSKMFTVSNKRLGLAAFGLGLILLGLTGCDDVSASGESAQVDASVDQRLVGRWRHTDTYVSGDFSAAIDLWFVLNPDGTYEYFKGAVAAGGSHSSLVSGGRGDVLKGKWRTESKVLFTCPEGEGGFQQAGKYFVDEGRFMVNKVVWERQ